MNASELFKKGALDEALQAQIAAVKSDAGDQNKRLFLFELLVFKGELDRAVKHLDLLRYDEVELAAAVEAYRKLLEAELKRRQLFEEGVPPRFLEEVARPEHVDLRLQAVDALRHQKIDEADKLLQQAQTASPTVKGQLNGKPFSVFRDCDDLFGIVLEVLTNGHYFWVPVEHVQEIVINPPRFPRDLIWIPARLQVRDNNPGQVFLPALYPSSYKDDNELVQLGRMTEFTETEPILGRGAKLFLAEADALPVLEWRELLIDAQPAASHE